MLQKQLKCVKDSKTLNLCRQTFQFAETGTQNQQKHSVFLQNFMAKT